MRRETHDLAKCQKVRGLGKGVFCLALTLAGVWSVAWLLGCLAGWLAGGLVGWLVGWLVGRRLDGFRVGPFWVGSGQASF